MNILILKLIINETVIFCYLYIFINEASDQFIMERLIQALRVYQIEQLTDTQHLNPT